LLRQEFHATGELNFHNFSNPESFYIFRKSSKFAFLESRRSLWRILTFRQEIKGSCDMLDVKCPYYDKKCTHNFGGENYFMAVI
jgi:hypothetical protein